MIRMHGIGGEASDLSVWGFIPLGIEHMLLGWDHLLFIGGVVLLAREWRRAVKLVSVFVAGHSITLIVATLAGWQVDAGAVDTVIAASVAFVGVVGLSYRRINWNVFGGVVAVFGLIHGLGLATRLQALGLPEDGVLWRVIAFNVGIEIGQVTAILAMSSVALLAVSFVRGLDLDATRKVASAALLVTGAAATAYVGVQAASQDAQGTPVAGSSDCTVGDRERPLPGGGGHATKDFYEPGEEAPLADFGHSIGDGYVVVLYPPDLETSELDALREFVTGEEGSGVLAGADPEGGDEVLAVTATRTMTCSEVDPATLATFVGDWFASL